MFDEICFHQPPFYRTYKISKRKKSNIVYLYITEKKEIVNNFYLTSIMGIMDREILNAVIVSDETIFSKIKFQR
jgi:hypothetical protein